MGTHSNVLQFNYDGKIVYNGALKRICFGNGWIKIGCTRIDVGVLEKLYNEYEKFINQPKTQVYQDAE
jgi:hypothetical protein